MDASADLRPNVVLGRGASSTLYKLHNFFNSLHHIRTIAHRLHLRK